MKHKDQYMIDAAMLKKSALCSALLLAGAIISGNAQAVTTLPTGSILMFQAGTRASTTNQFVNGGSYFGMDQDGNSKISPGEKTPISPYFGVPIGIVTSATGSHTGFPDGSENIGIDQPWAFFGNTGMDFVTTPITQLSTNTLDLSGWRVTWNGIPSINMGTGAWQPLNCTGIGCGGQTFSNGIANFTWGGTNGGTFSLTYAAKVPPGDPSGFGGVQYYLYLTGTVIEPGPLAVSGGSLAPGITGVAGYRLGDTDLANHGIPQDPDPAFQYPLHLYYDFSITSAPATANVVIPLASPLPASALYRKYNPNTRTWGPFDTTGGNAVSSAPGSPGSCPAPGDGTYAPGLTQGDYCVELTIVDNGTDDSNPTAGTISDPGGIATGTLSAAVDTRTSGTSGCSISPTPVDPLKRGDWWLLLGFVAWLGWYRRKRQH